MAEITLVFLKEKLKLFLGEAEIEEALNKAIASAGLVKKNSYSNKELEKFLEALITQGSFVEFVGRSIKANLLLGK